MPANVELATRGDLQELRAELLLRFAQVEGRMVEMDAWLSQQLAEPDKKIDDVNTSWSIAPSRPACHRVALARAAERRRP